MYNSDIKKFSINLYQLSHLKHQPVKRLLLPPLTYVNEIFVEVSLQEILDFILFLHTLYAFYIIFPFLPNVKKRINGNNFKWNYE